VNSGLARMAAGRDGSQALILFVAYNMVSSSVTGLRVE